MGTFHSVQVTDDALWTGAYYDAFSTLPDWVGGEPPLRVCILGYAAGTMGDLLCLHNPEVEFRIDGVEIDPEVTNAARRTMGLQEREGIRIFHADGRTFLQGRSHNSYDAIVLDAYARQVSIPAGLATKEFFALAKSRLRPGGILFVNLGAMRPGGRLVRALCDTMTAGFEGPVFRCPLEFQTNVLLVAARDAIVPRPPKRTPLLAAASFGLHIAGDAVLTDDFCPVESLTARDLLLE
jgi:spermidine synthase